MFLFRHLEEFLFTEKRINYDINWVLEILLVSVKKKWPDILGNMIIGFFDKSQMSRLIAL